ncbi:MAG: hypothetical protein SCALA702_26160 [Melioribacteraceae bacterium]|nr:MAG: hypothetical protein SCALA702_26160 [Melioribacteraceae bacterium]
MSNKTIIVMYYIAIFFFCTTFLFGYPNGIAGYTLKTNSSGCGACHGTHNGSSSFVLVDIEGPATLLPGSTGEYRVTISGGNGNDVGVDIACSEGVLNKVDNNLKVASGELVQTSSKNYIGGSYTFNFTYTAPANPGNVILYSTGMSSKKQWNFSQNFEITIGGTILQGEISLNEGWNIISVPVLTSNMAVDEIFPDATTAAFGFNGVYQTVSALENGKGYWIKYPQPDNIDVSGTDVSGNITLNEGWNLIGPFNTDINVNSISTIPLNIITSQYFGYSNGYSATNILEQGKGYWVNSESDGELILNSQRGLSKKELIPENCEKILFIDAAGNRTSLFWLEGSDFSEFILPPKPPVGGFDIRFKDDKYVGTLDNFKEILLSGINFPLTIFTENNYRLKDAENGKIVGEGKKFILTDDNIRSLRFENEILPDQLELNQNYPNPFNPSTTIKYAIPEDSFVNLSVYSSTGEKICTIVNDYSQHGKYSVTWDGTDETGKSVSSGTYFYQLVTGENILSKKMILIK